MRDLTPDKALIFRITHLANVPWILANGLHCSSSGVLDPDYRGVGSPDLIAKRARRTVPISPGGTLSDYVPFYFTPCSPMLFNIKTGRGVPRLPMADVVVLVSSLRKVVELGIGFVFSDRHAYLQTAQFLGRLEDLVALDWEGLQSRDFRRNLDDPTKFERYQAEALIHGSMPVNGLLGIGCYSAEPQVVLKSETERLGLDLKVQTVPGWYP